MALTKNPKKRPAAERMLFHSFVLAGDLTVRLSLDLLDRVRNPSAHAVGAGLGGLGGAGGAGVGGDDDEEAAVAAAPRRISSRAPRSKQKTQSELNS